MIILIAESKTMTDCNKSVTQDFYQAHRSQTDSVVTHFTRDWAEWSVPETAEKLGISIKLAAKMHNALYDFPNKDRGEEAIDAYTGVVFKALDYPTLPEKGKELICKDVRIISSLYGFLRPSDIVKPYRLDFNTKVSPSGESMAAYWKPTVTQLLLDTMRENDQYELLDLMPGDAAKCIDWRCLGNNIKRIKVDFKKITASESGDGNLLYKTPRAEELKRLRGSLLRQIACEDIKTSEDLKRIESGSYQFDEELSTDKNFVFITD